MDRPALISVERKHWISLSLRLMIASLFSLVLMSSAVQARLYKEKPLRRPAYQLGLSFGAGLAFPRSENSTFQELESQPLLAGLVMRSSAELLQLELSLLYQRSSVTGIEGDSSEINSINLPFVARILAPRYWLPKSLGLGIGLGFERRFFVNREESFQIGGTKLQDAINLLPVSLLGEWYLSHQSALSFELSYRKSLDSAYRGAGTFDELLFIVTLLTGWEN